MSKDLFDNVSSNPTKSKKDYFQKQNGTSYPVKSNKLKTPNLPPPPSSSFLRKSTK